ncbi:MAG: helix-turn-helix domain-containing protein [Bacteroidota bacterium]
MQSQLIFFFSALGAFNGLILSIYCAWKAKTKQFTSYFLALLLIVLSIRTIKSVFFYFNPHLANIFIQIGLSACILIGPFLFLYLQHESSKEGVNWKLHTLPYLVGITLLGIVYPYAVHAAIWSQWIVKGIYLQWLVYLVISFAYIKPIFDQIRTQHKLQNIDIWRLSIYVGVGFIWLGYCVGAYTSYIVGALSFSFILYLIVLLIIFSNNRQTTFFEEKEKYKDKRIEEEMRIKIEKGLSKLIDQEAFLNPNISLSTTAKTLCVPKHILSQYVNESLGKSFSTFINEHRIEKAKEFLQTKTKLTIEGIGYESGFNSKSTFFTAFKKITGQTPSAYQKNIGSGSIL